MQHVYISFVSVASASAHERSASGCNPWQMAMQCYVLQLCADRNTLSAATTHAVNYRSAMDRAAAGESPNGLNEPLGAAAVHAIFSSLGQLVHVSTANSYKLLMLVVSLPPLPFQKLLLLLLLLLVLSSPVLLSNWHCCYCHCSVSVLK
jgi:hypothetical protein